MESRDLNEIFIFTKVVELGSFTKASTELNIPISTVSTKVTSLEKRLGTTLLQRTTRQLKITSQGSLYYDKCVHALSIINQAEENILSHLLEPQGALKITAPPYLGALVLPEIIEILNKKYPKIKIELVLKDTESDLIADGVDVAIRAGSLKDSSLISKKVGDAYFLMFATNKYLKKFGTPKHPKDLQAHKLIKFTSLPEDQWVFSNNKTQFKFNCSSDLMVNDLYMAEMLALSHQGIALLPNSVCNMPIKKDLIQVLPEWKIASRPIYIIFPNQKIQSNKTKAFVEIAFEIIKKKLISSH